MAGTEGFPPSVPANVMIGGMHMTGRDGLYVVTMSPYGRPGEWRVDSVWPDRSGAVSYLTRAWRLVDDGHGTYHGLFGDGRRVTAHVDGPVDVSPSVCGTFAQRLGMPVIAMRLTGSDERVAVACNAIHDEFGHVAHVTSLSCDRASYVGFDSGIADAYADGCIVYDDACVQWVRGDASHVLSGLGLGPMTPCDVPALTERLAGVVCRLLLCGEGQGQDLGFRREGDGSVTVMSGGAPVMLVMPDFSAREL